MDSKLINARVSSELTEAIRIAAFTEGHNNRSKTIVAALESYPAISKELAKLRRSSKKKVS